MNIVVSFAKLCRKIFSYAPSVIWLSFADLVKTHGNKEMVDTSIAQAANQISSQET
jgi:hypothetical protein